MMDLQCLWPLQAELGEGPVWSESARALWFVDIMGRSLNYFDPATTDRHSVSLPEPAGFVVPCRDGGLLLGFPGALKHYDPTTGGMRLVLSLEQDRPRNRLNDATVDRSGCLWFGSLDTQETDPTGALYSYYAGELRCHDRNICITNGPAVSPNGTTLYHTQTLDRAIFAFDIDSKTRSTSGKRLLIDLSHSAGHPDGTAIDSEGCLWVSFFGGYAVRRYSPKGELLQTIDFPCANVTKLAFGAEDLCTAFVTTARKGLSPEERCQQPLAGGLFSFRVPVPGLSSTEFML